MRARVAPLATAVLLVLPASASAAVPHVVAPGESLSSVAAADGLSVEELAAANGLSSQALLVAGSTLVVPSTSGEGGPEAPTGEASAGAEGSVALATGSSDADGDADDGGSGESTGVSVAGSQAVTASSYVVQPGDTLSAIAARYGITVEGLAAANGLNASAPLLAGAVLSVAGGGEGGQGASAQPVGAAAEESLSAPPFPTAETVNPSEVGSIAAENGVPESLAEAIASQESGFNNALSSSADARGVMQILPGTWSWINENLSGSAPLAPASAASNVRGGVLLLDSLLNATGGNESLAAAGYFQGLPSVESEGELPATQEYVESVRALQQQFGGG